MSPIAKYYDSIAPDYDEQLTRDAGTRTAFHHLVADTVPPGSLLLDFGCGTGTDALWYATNGYRVFACDNSEGMLTEFRRKCAAQIADGSVTCACSDNKGLSALQFIEPPEAVVCNFAVMSHIDDVRPLFESFAALLCPEKYLIISVLDPFYWKDLRHAWWWKAIVGCLISGRMHVKGQSFDTYRHRMGTLDEAAWPLFVRKHRKRVFGQFIFLVYQRCE